MAAALSYQGVESTAQTVAKKYHVVLAAYDGKSGPHAHKVSV